MEDKNIIRAIKRALKKGDLKEKIFCSLIIAAGYSNWELSTLEIRYKNFLNLKHKYSFVIEQGETVTFDKSSESPKNIFILWLQGWGGVPPIVEACKSSVIEHMPDCKINLISEKNLFDYIDIPDYIVTKWKQGIISHAHFSDIIRTELLIKYGGFWLDATVFLTDSIFEWVYKQKLLMFQYCNIHDITMVCNNWFIYSYPGHPVLVSIRDGLYEYWKKENKVKEYFIWHQFATLAFEKYPEALNEMPLLLNTAGNVLSSKLLNKFDEEEFNYIKSISPIHKLTYKKTLPDDISGTYYEKLLSLLLSRPAKSENPVSH